MSDENDGNGSPIYHIIRVSKVAKGSCAQAWLLKVSKSSIRLHKRWVSLLLA